LNKELGQPSEMSGIGGDSKSYEVAFDQFKIGGLRHLLVDCPEELRSDPSLGDPHGF
jgi:hypothetical protein